MFEKLRVIIDVQTHNAKKMLSDFGSSIRNAEGFAGKLKAGWSSAVEGIKANAASLSLVAGGALVAFGIKAVKAFEDTAKAAVDMAKVTGQTVEQASRWIAVGKDYEVGADAIQGAMLKVQRKGIDFIDALVKINEAAPADKARVSFELFGKSAGSIAPLLGKTRGEYEKMLGAVEDGQVITDKEAKKAERMRLAQDALADALGEVTLAVGEQVAELGPYIEKLVWMLGVIDQINDVAPDAGKTTDVLRVWADEARRTGDAVGYLEDKGLSTAAAVRLLADTSEDAGQAAADAAPGLEDLMNAFGQAKNRAGDVEDLSDAFAGLLGLLGAEDVIDQVASDFDDVAEAAQEAFDASTEGAEDADEKARDYRGAVRDLKRDVIEFGDKVKGLPKERVTEILTAIDEGDYAKAEELFAQLAEDVTKTININVGGKFGDTLGGTKPGGDLGTVLEMYKELYHRSLTPITFKIHTEVDGKFGSLRDALERDVRTNGPLPGVKP